jgi:hypothetical protein
LLGPSAADYFSAAQYFYQSNGISIKRDPMLIALELSAENRSIGLKSLIQAKQGDKKQPLKQLRCRL